MEKREKDSPFSCLDSAFIDFTRTHMSSRESQELWVSAVPLSLCVCGVRESNVPREEGKRNRCAREKRVTTNCAFLSRSLPRTRTVPSIKVSNKKREQMRFSLSWVPPVVEETDTARISYCPNSISNSSSCSLFLFFTEITLSVREGNDTWLVHTTFELFFFCHQSLTSLSPPH